MQNIGELVVHYDSETWIGGVKEEETGMRTSGLLARYTGLERNADIAVYYERNLGITKLGEGQRKPRKKALEAGTAIKLPNS
jgi:hypothetical protein